MSKTFKEIMETYGRIADVSFKKCKVENKNTYSDFLSFDNESIVSVNYGFDGALYSSVMRRMEAKLMGKQTDKIIKEDMLRDFVLSLTDSDLGDSASVNYGGFFVAEPPEYDVATDTTKLICYDEMYRAMTEYKLSLDWSNGITVKNFLIAVCNEIGVVLDADSLSNMANADTLIDGEKFINNANDNGSSYTYRDVLDEIAKASGVSFAYKNSLGGNPYKLYAIVPTESGYVIDESNLKSLTIGASYGPVKGVLLSREPQEDNVYYPPTINTDLTLVKISNVQIMESSTDNTYRENFIQGIYNNVKNTTYNLYDLESYGIGCLNFGDIFTIKTALREDGTIGDTVHEYRTIFMRTDITLDGGIKEKSMLEAPVATSTDVKAASDTDKRLKRTMLKVDKQAGEIKSLVDNAAGLQTQITQNTEKIEATATAVTTVNGQIQGITKDVDELKNVDISKVVQTEVTKEATISLLAEKLETSVSGKYVTKTDFDDRLKDYAQTADVNTRISQTDSRITAVAERITTLEEADFITTAEAQSLIEQSAESIELSVTQNLKIGARNILLESACFEPFTPQPHNAAIAQFLNSTSSNLPSGRLKRIGFSSNLNGNVGFYFDSKDIIGQKALNIDKINTDTEYILTFWMNTTRECTFSKQNLIYAGDEATVSFIENKCIVPTVKKIWQKYTLAFKISGNIANFLLRFLFDLKENQIQIIGISSLKLEEGNVATDWSPGFEDIEQSVQAKIDLCVQKDENNNLTSEINISSNKLTIDTDNFKLSKTGNMQCKGAEFVGGKIVTTSSDDTKTVISDGVISLYAGNVTAARLACTDEGYTSFATSHGLLIYKGLSSPENIISINENLNLETGRKLISSSPSDLTSNTFSGYRHVRQVNDTIFNVCAGIYSDGAMGLELYNEASELIECSIKVKRDSDSDVVLRGYTGAGKNTYKTSPPLALKSDGLYYNNQKLAFA